MGQYPITDKSWLLFFLFRFKLRRQKSNSLTHRGCKKGYKSELITKGLGREGKAFDDSEFNLDVLVQSIGETE